jgi:hypothetical protein
MTAEERNCTSMSANNDHATNTAAKTPQRRIDIM